MKSLSSRFSALPQTLPPCRWQSPSDFGAHSPSQPVQPVCASSNVLAEKGGGGSERDPPFEQDYLRETRSSLLSTLPTTALRPLRPLAPEERETRQMG